MAVRTDLTVDFASSPRVATIASPSTSIIIQDCYDTLADAQARVFNSPYANLVQGFGKQALGGGALVGLTLSLRNCRLAFQARAGPGFTQCTVSGGNLTAVDANGDAMDPIQTTAYVQVTIAQSTSPSIASNDIPAIATAVWDELLSSHTTAGTLGAFMNQSVMTVAKFLGLR